MSLRPKLRGHGLHPAQSYTPAEIEKATGVPEATIRAWIRDGRLPAMTEGKPYLVLGRDVIAFFKSLRVPMRLEPDELTCLHCKKASKAMGAMVDFIHEPGANRARIEALCVTCEGNMSRGVAPGDLARLMTIFEVRVRGAPGN